MEETLIKSQSNWRRRRRIEEEDGEIRGINLAVPTFTQIAIPGVPEIELTQTRTIQKAISEELPWQKTRTSTS